MTDRHPRMTMEREMPETPDPDAALAERMIAYLVARGGHGVTIVRQGQEDQRGVASIRYGVGIRDLIALVREHYATELRVLTTDRDTWQMRAEEAEHVVLSLRATVEALRAALTDAQLQLQYLNEAGPRRGTTAVILTRIAAALAGQHKETPDGDA